MNASQQDFYSILGVRPDATIAEIEANYYILVKKFHPDVNSGDPALAQLSHNMTVGINLAYETLSDPEKRRQYDLSENGGLYGPPEHHHYGQTVRIESIAQAREILLELMRPYDGFGLPTPELEAAAKKEMERLLTKRTRRYIKGALPDEFAMAHLSFEVTKAADDAVEGVVERGIHAHVTVIYLLVTVIVSIAAAIRLAEGFFQGVIIALSSILFSAGYFQFGFLMARFIAHGIGYSLVGPRGYYVNGLLALLLIGLLVARRFIWQ